MTTQDDHIIPSVVIDGLSKKYGSRTILQEVTLHVRPGQVYALTGPNGAGKTTLIRLLTGLAFPTSGLVKIMGYDIHNDSVKARSLLGAVVEAPAKFYPQFTGTQNLKMHAELAMMAPEVSEINSGRIREVLALLELTRMADRPVHEYSLGQRQRLGVANAMLTNPKVMVLDEPTSGLDPLGIGLIHRIVTSLASSGCAVILSTHHLREIATYAHTVGILSGGRLVDTVDLRSRQMAYRFRVDDPIATAAVLEKIPLVTKVIVRAPYAVANLSSEGNVPDVLHYLSREGIRVYEASPDHFDLYDYYRDRVEHS